MSSDYGGRLEQDQKSKRYVRLGIPDDSYLLILRSLGSIQKVRFQDLFTGVTTGVTFESQ